MRSANRYAIRPRAPIISEGEVFARVLSAIRTLRAMPDRERRFLLAGTKSGWVQTLVEWSDLVARAEQPADDTDPHDKWHPKRSEISDAIIAGEWFAKLAVLPENVDEFEANSNRYRVGRTKSGERVKSAQVIDQKFLNLYASGFSLKFIGGRFGLNEDQAERRLIGIQQSLWRIANGTARIEDIDQRQRSRKSRQARHVGG